MTDGPYGILNGDKKKFFYQSSQKHLRHAEYQHEQTILSFFLLSLLPYLYLSIYLSIEYLPSI